MGASGCGPGEKGPILPLPEVWCVFKLSLGQGSWVIGVSLKISCSSGTQLDPHLSHTHRTAESSSSCGAMGPATTQHGGLGTSSASVFNQTLKRLNSHILRPRWL